MQFTRLNKQKNTLFKAIRPVFLLRKTTEIAMNHLARPIGQAALDQLGIGLDSALSATAIVPKAVTNLAVGPRQAIYDNLTNKDSLKVAPLVGRMRAAPLSTVDSAMMPETSAALHLSHHTIPRLLANTCGNVANLAHAIRHGHKGSSLPDKTEGLKKGLEQSKKGMQPQMEPNTAMNTSNTPMVAPESALARLKNAYIDTPLQFIANSTVGTWKKGTTWIKGFFTKLWENRKIRDILLPFLTIPEVLADRARAFLTPEESPAHIYFESGPEAATNFAKSHAAVPLSVTGNTGPTTRMSPESQKAGGTIQRGWNKLKSLGSSTASNAKKAVNKAGEAVEGTAKAAGGAAAAAA